MKSEGDKLLSLSLSLSLLLSGSLNKKEKKEKMWLYLKLVRIYTKPKGQLPDYASPVVLTQGKSSEEDFCNKIHRAILLDFKYALVWVILFLRFFS